MKVKVKGLVFVGFAAMIFAANAMAANEDKTVTSKAFTEATYQKLSNLATQGDATGNTLSTTSDTTYPSEKKVAAALSAVGGTVSDSTIDIKLNGTSKGTFTVNQATNGEVNIDGVEVTSNKTQTVAATGSTSNDKYPSETAVRAAITAAAGDYQTKSTTAQQVSDGAGGWEALTTTATPAQGSAEPFSAGGAYTLGAAKEDVSNKTQTVAATGSTSNDKYPSETAVRAAITAAAGDYQTKSTTAQQVSDGAGGWQALTTTATPTQDSTTPFTAGGAYTLNQAKEDVSNKTQTVAATGSTDNDKYPSETAVRAAITAVETAAATAYQDRSVAAEAQYVADGNGGWEALTKDTTVTSGSSNPVTSDAVYNAIQNSTGGLTIPAQNTNVCTAQHPCALVDVAGTLHWYTMAQDGYAGGELGDAPANP